MGLPGAVVTGIFESAGYLANMVPYFGNPDGDYENWLTKGAKEARESYMEGFAGKTYEKQTSGI
jgi:hypothetical protein